MTDNWALYEALLGELARVTTPHARAALLTADKRPLIRVCVAQFACKSHRGRLLPARPPGASSANYRCVVHRINGA